MWLDFTKSDSGYAGSFGSDALRVLDILFRQVRVDSGGVHRKIVGDATTSVFDGKLVGDRLSGSFRDGDSPGTFELRRTDEPTTTPYRTDEVHFTNGAVTLAGSLLMPTGVGPHPAIVFVHGSGA